MADEWNDDPVPPTSNASMVREYLNQQTLKIYIC